MVALPAPERIESGGGLDVWPPPVARSHVERADKLSRAGMLEAALAEERRAVELAPDDAYLRNNLGATLATLGHTEEARHHFQCAVDLEPGHPVMRRNLAYALWELNRRRDAVAVLAGLDHPHTKEAARSLSDLHLRELARKGALSWSGGKPRGSKLGIVLTPGPNVSEWIIDSRR